MTYTAGSEFGTCAQRGNGGAFAAGQKLVGFFDRLRFAEDGSAFDREFRMIQVNLQAGY